jgi:hypothetical protein
MRVAVVAGRLDGLGLSLRLVCYGRKTELMLLLHLRSLSSLHDLLIIVLSNGCCLLWMGIWYRHVLETI